MYHPLLIENDNVMPVEAIKDVVLLDRGYNTSCAINLHGATIESWRINNIEQLFISRQALFDHKHPIRGGISIVFPHYGVWKFGPRHGFSRIVRWTLEKPPEKIENGDVQATFSMVDDDFTRSMWNYQFKIVYHVVLRERILHFDIMVENTSAELPFKLQLLLNTYFRVPDAPACEIYGLGGCEFKDNKMEFGTEEEPCETVMVDDWVDRTYKNTPNELTISNIVKNLDHKMKITKSNLPDTVVWHPWRTIAKELADLGNNEYLKFICVGGAHMCKTFKLLPGTKFEASQTFQLMVKELDEFPFYM